jgi:signal transduction histidine kinase
MRAFLAAAVAMAALALCLAAVLAAVTGEVDIGITADNPGGLVAAVTPGGPAWEAGIRRGQRVVAVGLASDPGGWSIETSDGATDFRLSAASSDALLRALAIAPLAGLALAILGLRDARLRASRSEALSVFAIVLASTPSLALYQGLVSHISVVAAGAAGAIWLARWVAAPRRIRLALVLLGAGAGTAGAVGLGVSSGDNGHLLLVPWIAVASIGALAVAAAEGGMTPGRAVHAVGSVTLLDAALASALALCLAGLSAAGVGVPWLLATGTISVVAYARTRRAIRRALDRVLLSDVRERAAIRATEDERSRLAREIHDDPLQGIAGVIRQLEGPAPDAENARESLRKVATRLRAVVAELHPPVLDDLGLVPAIEAAARTASPHVEAVVDIDDRTGYTGAGRPPAPVELAVYRIVQEALNNAVRHAPGKHVWIGGIVSADLVDLTVADDGAGFSDARAEAALREGRIGLASMRQRAAGIDARLEIRRAEAGGAAVAVRWSP